MDAHLKKPSTNSVGNWTAEEDQIILRYVYEKGKSEEHMMWGNLSETLNGRSGKSCRERWFNHLDPKIKRTEWSQEEQWVLFILRNQSEEKWSLISKKLLGRTDNAVKNYWNSRLKKRIDSMQHAVNQHFERKKKQKILALANGEATAPLSEDQQAELSVYMERIRSEYLQKILDEVNNQNIEYFETLACEYTLRLQSLDSGQASSLEPVEDGMNFLNNPEVLRMHLDILYKSISFISKDRIESMLDGYKKTKEEKRRQEEERLQMQAQMKKHRGRQPAKKEEPKEVIPFKSVDRLPTKAEAVKEEKVEKPPKQLTIKPQPPKQTLPRADPGPTKTRSQAKEEQKDPPREEKMEDCSSVSSSSSAGMATRTRRGQKKKTVAVGIRLIMKKLKKQQKQYKAIDKIFISSKEDRPQETSKDPLMLPAKKSLDDISSENSDSSVDFQHQPTEAKPFERKENIHLGARMSGKPLSGMRLERKPFDPSNFPKRKGIEKKYEHRKLVLVKPQDKKKNLKGDLKSPASATFRSRFLGGGSNPPLFSQTPFSSNSLFRGLEEQQKFQKECKSPAFSMLGDPKSPYPRSPFPRLSDTLNLGQFKKEEEKPQQQLNIHNHYYFINQINSGSEGFRPPNQPFAPQPQDTEAFKGISAKVSSQFPPFIPPCQPPENWTIPSENHQSAESAHFGNPDKSEGQSPDVPKSRLTAKDLIPMQQQSEARKSQSGSRNRSSNNRSRRRDNYSTNTFFNQTMTQMIGKNRKEQHPLIKRKLSRKMLGPEPGPQQPPFDGEF